MSICLLLVDSATAQTIVGNVGLGDDPVAATVDPALNKIYVANLNSNSVTALDEFTNSTTSISVGAGPSAIAVNPATANVYVANTSDGTVTVIDGYTNSVTTTIKTGHSPVALVVNSITNQVYVANRDDNTVTIIDGSSDVTSTVTVGQSPVALVVNPVGNMVYVANQKSNSITALDGTARTSTTLMVGSAPSSLAVNPTTNVVYVVNQGDNTVTALNRITSSTATIHVGSIPSSIAINPITDRIYVTGSKDGSVTVIDGTTNTASSVPVGVLPRAIAIDSISNKIYVANDGNGQMSSGADLVSVIDGATNGVTEIAGNGGSITIALDPSLGRIYMPDTTSNAAVEIETAMNGTTSLGVGTSPRVIAFNSATSTAFICNYASASLTILDTVSNTATTIPVGNQPLAVAVNPVTNTIYVANSGDGTVSVVDGAAKSVVTTIPVGYSNSFAIAVNPVTNKIYVAVGQSNEVAIIDGASNGAAQVQVGKYPVALAVNPVTNKIYVANNVDGTVTIMDGDDDSMTTVNAVPGLESVAVNSNTNKIYVGTGTSTVMVIDGIANQTSTLTVTGAPTDAISLAINRQLNRIYAAADHSGVVAVIDGASDKILASVTVGTDPTSVVINPLSDQIYTSNAFSNSVTAIDGITNTPVTIPAGVQPEFSVLNSVNGKVYVTNAGSNSVSVITPNQLQTVPLAVSVSGVEDGQTVSTTNLFQTKNPSPSFTAQVTSSYTAVSNSSLTVNPSPSAVYYQVDGGAYPWTKAIPSGASGSNPAAFSLCLTNIPVGLHTLYLFPSYGDESAGSDSGNGVASSIQIGNVYGLTFLVAPGGTADVTPSASCASLQPPPSASEITTTTALSSNVNPQVLGSSVIFIATIGASTTSSTSLSGMVSFFDGATKLGTSTLASDQTANFTTSALALGNHSITASYSGDANYAGSASGILIESIVPPAPLATATAISSSVNPQLVGSSVAFTTTVKASLSNTISPSGTISIFDGTTKIGTSTLGSNLSATFATSSLALGSHSITASYSGDTYFAGSVSAALTESIIVPTMPGDFTLQSGKNTLSLPSGDWTVFPVTVTPINSFKGGVTLSCGGVPDHAQCVFQSENPASLTSGPATVQLAINTSDVFGYGTKVSQLAPGPKSGSQTIGALVALSLPLVGGLSFLRRRYRLFASAWKMTLIACFSAMVFGVQACSGKLPGKVSPGNYTISLIGTSNNGSQLQHEIPIVLTVTP